MIRVSEISRRLGERAEEVCRMLLPGGKVEKGDWVCGDISGSPGKSLKVHLTGSFAGKWQDWAAGDEYKGDLLDLWAICKGISTAEALKQARDYLGIRDDVGRLGDRVFEKPESRPEAPLNANGRAMKYLVETRKLDPAIVNRFRVEGYRPGNAIVFPNYSPEGELINRSYRTLPAGDEKKKVWQDKGCAPSLFGWQALDASAYQTRTILLCEGQIDAMTWTQWGVNALSIPNGSGQTWVEYEWDNLAVFDNIYVSFDSDGAGYENTRKTIERLGRHRCLLVEIPKKDANDCLLAGLGPSDAEEWIKNAKAPTFEGVIRAVELGERIMAELAPKPPPITVEVLKGYDELSGFHPRPGEVTLWSGITHHGKTTFLNSFILMYLCNEIPCFVCSMEVKPEKNCIRMLTSIFEKRPLKAHVDSFLKEIAPFLVFADVLGSIAPDKLLEMMRFSFQRYGAMHFFIDSLMRVDGLEEDHPKQGKFMNDLLAFSKSTGAHVHLVAHPRKVGDGDVPRTSDIKGSVLLGQNADNILTVVRNMEKKKLIEEKKLTPYQDESMWDNMVIVDKQRETGWLGRFKLRFNPRTYRFTSME